MKIIDAPILPAAVCADTADPDLWFTPEAEWAARRICAVCPERAPCLDWGGLSERERERLGRQRARKAGTG